MDREEILKNLQDSVVKLDVEGCRRYAEIAMDAGMPPEDAIEKGLAPGMDRISDMFDEGTVYLPQILIASKALDAALDVLVPYIENKRPEMRGIVVMGSVKGDIHSIGKNVCCAMLRGAGFRVVDLGTDVDPDKFVKAVEKHHPDIVGASALMTVSLPQQRQLVRIFKENGMSVLTIFGGAPCSQEWVDEIGGDGYSDSGASIVRLVRSLLGVDNQAGSGQKDYIGIDRDWEPDDGQTLCRHFRGI